MAQAFARIRTVRDASLPAAHGLELADAWKLFSLWLPPPRLPEPADIAVPESIAADSRRRMAFRAGALAARELGLDAREFGADELIALGRETIADHVLSGTVGEVLIAVARLEGKVDDAAWKARDAAKIAEQIGVFLEAEFRDEIALHQALEGLAAEPPLLGRQALASALLREHDLDPNGVLERDHPAALYDVSASSPALVRDWKAGEFYFQADKLNADVVRRMKTLDGRGPAQAHIDRVLAALPASLDAEFRRRFDAHKQRMSALLAKWLSVRLSLHAKEASIDLAGATVTMSRLHMRYFTRAPAMRPGDSIRFSHTYGTVMSQGFLVSIEAAGAVHRCFVSTRTGQVHALRAGESLDAWLRREHELVFDDSAARARLAGGPAGWLRHATIHPLTSGSSASMRERLTQVFAAEIEQGREAARGQTWSEGAVDTLLDLIPFRAMVVALRKGNIPAAIVMGGLDVLSLLPLIGAGVRLSGAVAKSAAPWLGMGLRMGSRLGGRAATALGHMGGGVPALTGRVRAALTKSAIHGWARLRPLDVSRMAQALRTSAPGLAGVLDGIVARARGVAIPDGVWRVGGRAGAAAETSDAITSFSGVTARNSQGGRLALLPYGERAGAYTQVDIAGRRVGALLVVDRGGWLHQTMPVASLERYRVASPTVLRALEGRRPGADGTVTVDGDHYARIGSTYVQVRRDLAASTATRPIWRAVAPPGVTPDLIAHRLFHDPDEKQWRQALAPGLAGGHRPAVATPAILVQEARLRPDAAQLARFREALAGGMRGATQAQADAVRALVDWIASNPRGKAILNAMCAHYELLGEVPEIVLREGLHATRPRPSLYQPVPGKTWHLDLGMLRLSTTEAAVDEIAAVYNNMTGILQNVDPFDALMAQGGPPLDPRLEQDWAAWIAHGPGGALRAAGTERRRAPGVAARQATVSYLRTQLREIRCHGGLEREALKTLLRRPDARTMMKIDLSGRRLDSVPPLPTDTRLLSLSNNPIRDWRNLPQGLIALDAERVHMRSLPPNLPASLRYLNLSNNLLRGGAMALPPRLERLEMARNRLASLPALPATLQELIVSENALRALPAGMPGGLQLLNVNGNLLTQLPADLPAGLRVLLARNNQLAALPHPLPADLQDVDLSFNLLETLPELPGGLRTLDARSNRLSELPGNLPGSLDVLVVSHNRLRRLPDRLPMQLSFLGLQSNAIETLPAYITALTRCWIFLDGNPLTADDLPIVPPGLGGPRFSLAPGAFADPSAPITLAEAVRPWLAQSPREARARWEALGDAPDLRGKTAEFTQFLVRLRHTLSHGDPGFRGQVEEWLVALSRPERRTLLVESLVVCAKATESCDDRIITVWNDLQLLHRNDDIRLGLYDERVAEVVDIARQMFRITALIEIARRRERLLLEAAALPGGRDVDRLEVYLSHMVHLRDALGLTIVAPRMQFHDALAVPDEYLAEVLETVRARERDEFDQFLVLDYASWQTLLKRKDAAAYARARAAADQAVHDRFDQELDKAVAALALPDDPALLEEARKDLGPKIMRDIRYGVMAPLTRALLAQEPVHAPPPPD